MYKEIEYTLQKVEKTLKARKQRFTAPRRYVLATLLQSSEPLKAYDIVERLDDTKPMTVYRALDFLSAEGLIHRIESLNAYCPCTEGHCAHTDSQFLICDKCGKVQELHNHAIDDFINKSVRDYSFKPQTKKIEIHGLCKSCQN